MSTGSTAVVVFGLKAERRVAQVLRDRGATEPDRAVPLKPEDRGDRSALDRLVGRGVIQAAGDGYWLDETALAGMKEGRKARAVLMVLSLLLLVAVIFLLGTRIASAGGP